MNEPGGRKRRYRWRGGRRGDGTGGPLGPATVALLGNLKTGKSTLFEALVRGGVKRQQVPGLGAAVTLAPLEAGSFRWLVDLPGVQALDERSEDARLMRWLLARQLLGAAILVIDARRLRRGLALALEIGSFGLPVVVALNMIDEARAQGLRVDVEELSRRLGVPVVEMVAREGRGVRTLRRALSQARPLSRKLELPAGLVKQVDELDRRLGQNAALSPGLRYLAAVRPGVVRRLLRGLLGWRELEKFDSWVEEIHGHMPDAGMQLAEAARQQAADLAAGAELHISGRRSGWLERLGNWMRQPLTGLPFAALVLVLAYLFVGVLGAQELVDLLEGKLFGQLLLPAFERLLEPLPWPWVRELLVGPFGLVSVGITLALGIVLPVLATFFIAFAVLEDSGYLARLSLLLDRVMRRVGLTGKGVLPVVMGFSCVTMAVLTTRMLDTRKQRLIATLLLVMTIPCAPLLGVMMVALGRLHWTAGVVLALVLTGQFFLVGFLANLLVPGRRPEFIMEVPRLRLPKMRNVLLRSYHNLVWFMREAIPYFLLGTLVMFGLEKIGLLDVIRHLLQPVSVKLLGLPIESADAFLMTLIRREAGAALLVQQLNSGLYDGVQVLVTLVVMTVMLPCINTLLVMLKERGAVVTTVIVLLSIVVAVLEGGLVGWLLRLGGASF